MHSFTYLYVRYSDKRVMYPFEPTNILVSHCRWAPEISWWIGGSRSGQIPSAVIYLVVSHPIQPATHINDPARNVCMLPNTIILNPPTNILYESLKPFSIFWCKMNSGCLAILLGGLNKIATGVARTGARYTKVLPPSKYVPVSVFSLPHQSPSLSSQFTFHLYIYSVQ